MRIEGGNNPHNSAHVNDDGRVEARAVSLSEQSFDSIQGDAYNVNTGNITLTNASETPIFYIKNDTEDRDLIVNRVFYSFGSSTGGSGDAFGKIYKNVTAGTILTATEFTPGNFNLGSSKTLGVDARKGATGTTFTATASGIEFLFPAVSQRVLIAFESIVIPRGASMLVTYTPPSGNTSMVLQAGANVYLAGQTE